MKGNNYANQKLDATLEAMMTSDVDVFLRATFDQFEHITPENDLPSELHELFASIENKIDILRKRKDDQLSDNQIDDTFSRVKMDILKLYIHVGKEYL